jgi:hypothetical protein
LFFLFVVVVVIVIFNLVVEHTLCLLIVSAELRAGPHSPVRVAGNFKICGSQFVVETRWPRELAC